MKVFTGNATFEIYFTQSNITVAPDMTRFYCKPFDQLSTTELYEILKLRQEIFVVEQNCPYLDCDDKDIESQHLCGYKDGALVAYARLIPKGISYNDYSSIGRVVTKQSLRNTGLGKQLMTEAIKEMHRHFPNDPVKISSQVYIMPFYASLGFRAVGAPYLEDDIPHQAMILELSDARI